LANPFDNRLEAIGLDGFGEDLRITGALSLDNKRVQVCVAGEKNDSSSVPLGSKPPIGIDA
jgi:hypothetical protein